MDEDSSILVLGANGQIGSALIAFLGKKAIGLTQAQANLAYPAKLLSFIERYEVCAVINAAAYTAVDKAEREPELAFAINSESPGMLAKFCAMRSIPLIHYSTDYVFDGSGNLPWCETDTTSPLNVYGHSKRAGEIAIQETGADHLIFRTSWVYSAHGKNFLNTMLRLASEQAELRVVADQIGAPSFAGDIAEATGKALSSLRGAAGDAAIQLGNGNGLLRVALNDGENISGIYHLCHAGETSWYDFASQIFGLAHAYGEDLRVKRIIPINSSDYPTPAKRPLNSRLDCSLAKTKLGIALPSWQEGLKACMAERYANIRLPA